MNATHEEGSDKGRVNAQPHGSVRDIGDTKTRRKRVWPASTWLDSGNSRHYSSSAQANRSKREKQIPPPHLFPSARRRENQKKKLATPLPSHCKPSYNDLIRSLCTYPLCFQCSALSPAFAFPTSPASPESSISRFDEVVAQLLDRIRRRARLYMFRVVRDEQSLRSLDNNHAFSTL